MFKNVKNISVVLSAILIGSMGLAGCSRDSSSSTETQPPVVPPPAIKTISGVAVDGYIKESTVTLNDMLTQTSSLGRWSIPYIGDNSHFVSVKGGIDTTTNKPFEGTLKAELGADGAEIAVTPLSTLVSSLVQSGVSKAAASTKIATQLDISEATLAGDPIAILATGTAEQKREAASAMKSFLTFQKAAEAFAKSMGDAGSDNYEATFAGVYEVFAKELDSASQSNSRSLRGFAFGLSDSFKLELSVTVGKKLKKPDPYMYTRLEAASEGVARIISAVQSISNEDFQNNGAAAARTIEHFTTLIENQLVKISKTSDITAIESIKKNALKVAEDNNVQNLLNSYIMNPSLPIADTTPTEAPTVAPTEAPTVAPTEAPTEAPTVAPTEAPTQAPTVAPTEAPTVAPTEAPTEAPTVAPTEAPTQAPTVAPTEAPTSAPYTAVTCATGSNIDNLSGGANIYDTYITVDCISNATLASNVFSLTKTKLVGTTFESIDGNLSGLLDIKLTAADHTSSLNKDVMVTILIKGQGTDYVAAATKANFLKSSGALSVTVPASGNILRMGTSIDGTTLTATKANAGVNSITSSTVNGKQEINISATSIIDEFANNALIGNTIKQYMVDYTTSAGTYDVYLLINATSGSASFIGGNSTTIDATGLNTLVSGSGVTYTSSEKAVKVRLTIQ